MTSSAVLRAALLGTAAGGRSALGIAAPVLTSSPRWPLRAAALAAVAGELVADKLPGTPDRTMPPSAAVRLVSGAAGGWLLARRGGGGQVLPALAGAAGAATGTLGGARWRRAAAPRLGALPAALVEDALVLALAAAAARATPDGPAGSRPGAR
ncbi:hypothetical protein SAMN05660464_3340 [Geodermatophilus dictyosporus]|uniref:DUF4126 domain-containing protein n=1 Tax=Geodermatophilus dictyosporus TaxID=1523247 RepID=A0A1I5QW19_9ACTN|nr:hypothetical protein [Geodermatophilus dictyosporus]SFP50320.1 hypothetical protein SAMN05660464_3340 [Geodermatophilus dictyosporus]